jgi:GntR family transcriptional repressor for pyruvate dehydrogenase complex
MPSATHFRMVRSEKKSTQIAAQIIDAIQDGIYKAGDRIPSERTIAKETGVSRPSVREAISALQIAGIVESKGGSGCYAKEIPPKSSAQGALNLLDRSLSPYEMLEARKTIEPLVSKLAAKKATARHLESLRKSLLQIKEAANLGDAKAFDSADYNFHIAIASSTGNEAIRKIVQYLLRPMRGKIWHQLKVERDGIKRRRHFDVVIASHGAILKAIERGKGQEAEKEMVKHIDFAERSVFEAESDKEVLPSGKESPKRKVDRANKRIGL